MRDSTRRIPALRRVRSAAPAVPTALAALTAAAALAAALPAASAAPGTPSASGHAPPRDRGLPALTTVAAAPAVDVSAARDEQVRRCHHSTPDVWLTFDDYGSAEQVRAIVATLTRNGVRGRFFVTGTWARAKPGLVALMRGRGHALENHTSTHANLERSSDRKVLAEIRGGVVEGTSPGLLRPPYGAGAFTTRLQTLAASQGHRLCFWTVDTHDWEGASAASIVRRVKWGDATSPRVEAGGVVLMHLHGRHTAAALQGVIDAVRDRGLTLERLAR